MQTGEIKLLRHIFRMQQNEDKKRDLLFENAVKLKNVQNLENIERKTEARLYPGEKHASKAFEKLKARLRTDILNVFLLSEASGRCTTKHDTYVYNCKRYILQSEILLKRGLYREALAIIEKASVIARKNELYTEQILIDNICSNYNLTKFKEIKGPGYNNEIQKVTTLIEKLAYGKQFCDELVGYTMFKIGEEPPFDEWDVKLEMLEKYCSGSDSSRLLFYLNICSVYVYRHKKEYGRSLEFALSLLKQENDLEVFKTFLYKGNIHLEAARCYLLLKNYDEAIYHSSYAVSQFGKDMKNVLSSCEVLFYSFINAENYEDALKVTNEAFSNPYLQKNNFVSSKWWFLRAGVEFKLKNCKASIASLKKCNELYKDKSHWMLACNLFETICRIENGDLEWFEYRSEGLRKIMMRHNKGQRTPHNNRFGLIYQILKTLNKNNFDFSQTLIEEKESIQLLSEDNENFLWNVAGCEIVRFDVWIKQKALNDPKNRRAQLVA